MAAVYSNDNNTAIEMLVLVISTTVLLYVKWDAKK